MFTCSAARDDCHEPVDAEQSTTVEIRHIVENLYYSDGSSCWFQPYVEDMLLARMFEVSGGDSKAPQADNDVLMLTGRS
jgi:hypothetical protein